MSHDLPSKPSLTALPFILGEREALALLPDQCGEVPFTKIPINGGSVEVKMGKLSGASFDSALSPERFARLLNLANGVCYGGGMGMPEWVMLDCALLPSCFVGWMTPASALSAEVRDTMNRGLSEVERGRPEARVEVEHELGVPLGPLRDQLGADEWVPSAEFCSIPRLISSEVVGYSLYSLVRGLGVRAKALGLWVMTQRGVRKQVGVAQWSNLPALRAHLRFGPLELIDPLTPLHTRAGETMIYRLTLPAPDELLRVALGSSGDTRPDHMRSRSTERAEWIGASDLPRWLTRRRAGQRERAWVVDARRGSTEVEVAVNIESLA